MYRSLIIVDDFLDNANDFRHVAMGLDYPPNDAPFPGRNSLQRINIPGLADEISHILGEPLRPLNPPQSHGKFRITLASDIGKAKVHTDPAYWSGIIYLSRPEDCKGGTDFFRHKRTNTDRVPDDVEALTKLGYSSYSEMLREIVARDSLDETQWELAMRVPMRFNRLVLLRPWLWHTAGPGFGDGLENGRLIYVLFFEAAR